MAENGIPKGLVPLARRSGGLAALQRISPSPLVSPQTQKLQRAAQAESTAVLPFTVSNGTGVTISNLGYYTTTGTSISTAAWGVYTNYMKPKTFKLR